MLGDRGIGPPELGEERHVKTYSRREVVRIFGVAGAAAALLPERVFGERVEQAKIVLGDGVHKYEWIQGWAKLPDGRKLGQTSAIDIDRNGNIWVFERCGANSCAGSNLSSILKFDASGKLPNGAAFTGPRGLKSMLLSVDCSISMLSSSPFSRRSRSREPGSSTRSR
jgi:hypothetical protein